MEQISVSNKKLVNEESKILRECRGRRMAISRRVYGTNTTNSKIHFYVASESSSTDRYYFVEYKDNWNFCTCMDYASNRLDKCKHIFAVEYALRLGLVQSIDRKLPLTQSKKVVTVSSSIDENINKPKSWEADYYDF